jgi:hypothetical protein
MTNKLTPKSNGGGYSSPSCRFIDIELSGRILKVSNGDLPKMIENTEDW